MSFQKTFFKDLFIYLRGRERLQAGGGEERERERDSPADFPLSVEPAAGLDPQDLEIRT